jgi:hypothetical protein
VLTPAIDHGAPRVVPPHVSVRVSDAGFVPHAPKRRKSCQSLRDFGKVFGATAIIDGAGQRDVTVAGQVVTLALLRRPA